MNNVLTVGVILLIAVGVAAIIFYYYKKRNLEQFYNQIFQNAKQVPKQKKNSFLLLMFKESLSAAKKKSDKSSFASKLQNPKYLDIQLVQMSNILKDTSKVEDKLIKKSLSLLNDYQKWEKAKIAKDQEATQTKSS